MFGVGVSVDEAEVVLDIEAAVDEVEDIEDVEGIEDVEIVEGEAEEEIAVVVIGYGSPASG